VPRARSPPTRDRGRGDRGRAVTRTPHPGPDPSEGGRSGPPPPPPSGPPPASPPTGGRGERWQRQVTAWATIVAKFGIQEDRYEEFAYLQYLDVNDPFVENYVGFHMGTVEPIIKHRIRNHAQFWDEITSLPWLLEVIKSGIAIPFEKDPPRIMLANNKTAVQGDAVQWVRNTLIEYMRYGFVHKVDTVPYCVMPLQVKDTGGKMALIYDMSVLNDFVEKRKFKLEGWEEMFNYSASSKLAIKFDLKKFYHEIDIREDQKRYFGFMYQMEDGCDHTYFVWDTVPYGYTRAPYIAKSLMKPLVTRWRRLGIKIVVFYDDGMAVGADRAELKRAALQIQCDLLRAGLVPGIGKCIWIPTEKVAWNGLIFDFEGKKMAVMDHRISYIKQTLRELLLSWPKVTYRDLAKFLGQLNSMHPVLKGLATLHSKMIQIFVNIRHFNDYKWEGRIWADTQNLYELAYKELVFWNRNLDALNVRMFFEKVPNCCGWVDASGHAVGGVLVRLAQSGGVVPVTMDNWLLDGAGLLPRIRNCASLQVGGREQGPTRVTDHDLDPAVVKDMFVIHRNLTLLESVTDSNERELMAAVEMLTACGGLLRNGVFTLHFDNINAAIICEKGSSKFRLHFYALRIADLCAKYNIQLNPVWIPRCLNNAADKISKMLDYEDYQITDVFYQYCLQISGFIPNFDRFANNWNAKTPFFNSAVYCVGSSGVDAFRYHWGPPSKNWIFPPPPPGGTGSTALGEK